MEQVLTIAGLAALSAAWGFLAVMAGARRRALDAMKLEVHLQARASLAESRLALLRRRRERAAGLLERLKGGGSTPAPGEGAPSAGAGKAGSPAEEVAGVAREVQQDPGRAAAVLRTFLRT
jgi:hypothetical protein